MDKDNYAIEMLNITRTFNNGAIVANDNLTLRVREGEIHALVGENGAGKTTLMGILFGFYPPTSGQIRVNGRPVIITGPVKAAQLKIGMVHQHFKLVAKNRVWENIILGSEEILGGVFLNTIKIKHDLTKIMEQYELYVDLEAKIDDLPVGFQQRVEILKILYRQADILVFDEPTAVLTPKEIKSFLKIVKNLKKGGKTIIFISHKMEEIKAIADRATVIKLGKNVGEFVIADLKGDELVEAMVGRKLEAVKNAYTKRRAKDKTILNIRNLTVPKISQPKLNGLENFNLKINAGEIVAIAGIEGNGQQELVEAITGLTRPIAGTITYKGQNMLETSIKDRYRLGMSHVPEDRHKHGLFLDLPISENMALQNIDEAPYSQRGILRKSQINLFSNEIIKDFDIRGTRAGHSLARGLSGGNQQKAIVGRELRRPHDLLIISQPTRGLDIGAIEYIHGQLLKERDRGVAILLISSELNEVMALADRIAVLSEGHLTGILNANGAKKEEIGALMTRSAKNQTEAIEERELEANHAVKAKILNFQA